MNSVKTKSTEYTLLQDKAIGGFIVEPTETGWMFYVAWEWPDMASQGYFAIVALAVEDTDFKIRDVLNIVADYGKDVTHIKEIRTKFPQLFKN